MSLTITNKNEHTWAHRGNTYKTIKKTLLHMLLHNESNFPTFCKMRLNTMQLLEIVTEKARLTD